MQLPEKVVKSYRLLRRRRRRRQPPVIHPGDICATPDYIGIGVQRSGSTWWDNLIAAHPAVHSPPDRVKEVHYFDLLYDGLGYGASVPEYSRFFPRPPGFVAGEWTPRYLYDAWALPLIREVAPAAKLLVILRDPVDRYVSALTLQRQWGRGFDRNFLQHAFQRGLYASQLERLWAIVPPNEVLVLQFERCLVALESELSRTYGFLGIDTTFVPTDAKQPRSKSQIPRVTISSDHLNWLRQGYRADVERLFEMVPSIDRSLWSNF
jgi:hypothetical protein